MQVLVSLELSIGFKPVFNNVIVNCVTCLMLIIVDWSSCLNIINNYDWCMVLFEWFEHVVHMPL